MHVYVYTCVLLCVLRVCVRGSDEWTAKRSYAKAQSPTCGIHVHVHMHTRVGVAVHVHVHSCVHVRVHVHMHVHVYVFKKKGGCKAPPLEAAA